MVQAERTVDSTKEFVKALTKTRKIANRGLLTAKLLGKWHGTMSDPALGEVKQEFEWIDDKRVLVMIIGTKMECTYTIRTDLPQIDVR